MPREQISQPVGPRWLREQTRVFLVTRPFTLYHNFYLVTLTLNFDLLRKKKNFGPDPKLFYGTFSRNSFKCPIFAFQCSF